MSIAKIAILAGCFLGFSASLRADDSPQRLPPGRLRLSVTQPPPQQQSAPSDPTPRSTPPTGNAYDRWRFDPPRLVREIQAAIAADPKNGGHHFNLAVAAGMLLSPPDLPTARAAYQRALALGQAPDPQLDRLLK